LTKLVAIPLIVWGTVPAGLFGMAFLPIGAPLADGDCSFHRGCDRRQVSLLRTELGSSASTTADGWHTLTGLYN
jgi:hypothetical protein